jgi:uncharacterized protein
MTSLRCDLEHARSRKGAFNLRPAIQAMTERPIETADDICALVARQADMMRLLGSVAELDLPDCWIGAGFLRNAVWDVLHGRAPNCGLLNDIDVVFFDRATVDPAFDAAIEDRLAARSPSQPWSVKNQARMHVRNADEPYRDTAAAIARWPETATAVAVRLLQGRLELLAPHGLEDLVGLTVRPTPAFAQRPQAFARRLGAKNWLARWPRLRIVNP